MVNGDSSQVVSTMQGSWYTVDSSVSLSSPPRLKSELQNPLHLQLSLQLPPLELKGMTSHTLSTALTLCRS